MKIIHTLTFIFISLSTVIVSAQNKSTQKADKLFNRLEYVAAAKEYHKLVDAKSADAYVYKQLADSYYMIFNSREAAQWYSEAVKSPQDAETYYRYAQMLKANGKYEKADEQMKKFAQLAPSDERAQAYKANPNYLPKLNSIRQMYNVSPLDINSDKSDFGANLSSDNVLYFATARNTARKSYAWNKEPYLDIYQSIYSNGTFSEPTAVEALNTKFHEGPVSVSSDGNTLYFSSESYNEDSYEKDKSLNARFGQVNLFKATKNGDTWGNITPLPFNSSNYSTSNPSISKDGRTLYFASNMPGGKGGNDIWKVSVNADGSYGTPENLGSKVNTAGNESFPFITEDNRLFFASDGKQGFGGLDIFEINLKSNTEAQNLGKPVNSEKDDFGFTFNTSKNIGFLSSNRKENDDMYKAEPICGVELITLSKDSKTGLPLSGVEVSLVNSKGKVLDTQMSGSTGEARYATECNQSYSVQVSKSGYQTSVYPVASHKGGQHSIETPLSPIEVIITEREVILNPIYFEYDKSHITEQGAAELDKLVTVMKEKPEMVIFVKSHTDTKGTDAYNIKLSERRNQSTLQYIISKGIDKTRLSGQGYGESQPMVDCKDDCTEEQSQQNRRSEFIIVRK